MASSFTCDWCGHSIDNFSALHKMFCCGFGGGIREWHFHRPDDGYQCMEQAIEAFDRICGIERPAPLTRPKADVEERVAGLRAWRDLSAAEQEHHIFKALGAERLRPRDVVHKITVTGDWLLWSRTRRRCWTVWPSAVTASAPSSLDPLAAHSTGGCIPVHRSRSRPSLRLWNGH
jgi:hypothetical protein